MFDNLTGRLTGVIKTLTGRSRLSEGNIESTLREVRKALLEADVGLEVVKDFIEIVRTRALGQEVIGSLTPGQALIKVVRDELATLMGEKNAALNLATEPPAIILMAGLQGSGKTTTTAKLARMLKEEGHKKVSLASCDIYRPGAEEQLRILANAVGVNYYSQNGVEDASELAVGFLQKARRAFDDVLIVDTAGRLTVDVVMMEEIAGLHKILQPVETLFVIDSMMGQDAVETARAFNETLPLTGVILTKIDGDARGGAALTVRQVTGRPIKFVGTGEKPESLESFYPDRVASRILGMGDVLSLIEEVEQKVDQEKAVKVAKKISKGKSFDLQDFRDQLDQMKNVGGISALLEKLPSIGNLNKDAKGRFNDDELARQAVIIDSMTVRERMFPALIKGSRKKRIAAGSGTQVQDVNKLLKQFLQMQKMMKKMTRKGGIERMMKSPQNPFAHHLEKD